MIKKIKDYFKKKEKFLEGFGGSIIIITIEISFLTLCFYPFYKWDSEIRGTLIEDIFEPGYGGHGTYFLAIVYNLMNLVLFYNLHCKKNKMDKEIENLKKQLEK